MKIRDAFRGRRAVIAVAVCAPIALGACQSIDDALDGINPIARTLDSTAKKNSSAKGYRQPLAVPPDYSLRPPAGKAETRSVRDTDPKATGTAAGTGATVKVADPKRIDLGTSTTSEKPNRTRIDASGRVVREGRVETRGKAIVKEGDRSKGEDELLKRSTKKGS